MLRRPLHALSLLAAVGAIFGVAAACNVYDESLLGGGGAGGGSSTSTNGTGGEEPPVDCDTPADCPGDDNECGTRTCVGGKCGVDAVPAGTPVAQQTPGDCLRQECDGAGLIVGVADDSDAADDDNDCTTDSCSGGIPSNDPRPVGSVCSGAGGGEVCNAEAVCVECVDGGDCSSGICTESFTCAPASCGDTVKNGSESDIDCGGSVCPKCAIGDDCNVGSDCLSNACSGTCQPSCTDGIRNQDESDVDCGGVCDDCAFGQTCNTGDDCDTGACTTADTCGCAVAPGQILVSELRTRGPAGGNDEFIELFNPTNATIDISGWVVEARSGSGTYSVRYTAPANTQIGAGRHFLIANNNSNGYSGSVAPDGTYTSGMVDHSAVVLRTGVGGAVVDAVCFDGANCATAPAFGPGDPCEGMPKLKVDCADNVDDSIERRPGGALGNCVDTENNATDFVEIAPSNPQNLASPPTP